MSIVQIIDNRHSQDQKSSRPLDRWQDKLSEEQRQALCDIFLLALHKAKHARPMHSYEEDNALFKRLGVNVRHAEHRTGDEFRIE